MNVYRRSLQSADVFNFAVPYGPSRVPARKYRFDGQLQLLDRILRESLLGVFLEHLLVFFTQFLEAFRRYVGIFLNLVLLLDLGEGVFEMFVVHAHNDVTVHVDQSSIRVVGKPFVFGRGSQTKNRLVGEAQV